MAQVSNVELELDVKVLELRDIDEGYKNWLHVDGDYIYLSNKGITSKLNVSSGEWYDYDPETTFDRIIGQNGDEFFVTRDGPGSRGYMNKSLYSYNFTTDEMREVYFEINRSSGELLTHYIGDKFFYGYQEGEMGTSLVNYTEALWKPVLRFIIFSIVDVSPDKLHALGYDGRGMYVINLLTGKKTTIDKIQYSDAYSHSNTFFLSNELIFSGGRFGLEHYAIDLNGNKVLSFSYTNPEYDPDERLRSKLQRLSHSPYFVGRFDTGNHLFTIKGEHEALDELGLLFKQTTGRCNDSRVRMREYPLLEAGHLAFLNNGDELEILDRSGIEVEISDMKDYWYKVRRISDGLEGWSYGAFIDVDETD